MSDLDQLRAALDALLKAHISLLIMSGHDEREISSIPVVDLALKALGQRTP